MENKKYDGFHDEWNQTTNAPDYYMGLNHAFIAVLERIDELISEQGDFCTIRDEIANGEIRPLKRFIK